MINEVLIELLSGKSRYKKGLDIYNDYRVSGLEVINEDGYIFITASVKMPEDNLYQVYGKISTRSGDIEYVNCECPAYEYSERACEHCVAVLIGYVRSRDGIGISKVKSPSDRTTTPEVKALLTNHIKKRTYDVQRDADYGKVKVLPSIEETSEGFTVEFKIGVKRMYTLKNIYDFNYEMENSLLKYYGEKIRLQFLHTMDAFVPESRKMVRFIQKWVNRNSFNEEIQNRRLNADSAIRDRTLFLSDTEVTEFLDALGGNEVRFTRYYTDYGYYKIFKGKPPRRITILGEFNGIMIESNEVNSYNLKDEIIYLDGHRIYRDPSKGEVEVIQFVKYLDEASIHAIFIHENDVPAFCKSLLPLLEKRYHVKKIDFDENDYIAMKPSFEIYLDELQGNQIACRVMAVYGENKYNVLNKQQDFLVRDYVGETEILNIVSPYFSTNDEISRLLVAENDDVIFELFASGVSKMQSVADVYISDSLKRINVINEYDVDLGISVTGNNLELKMISKDVDTGLLLDILKKYNPKKKYHKLKNGSFVDLSGGETNALVSLAQSLHMSEYKVVNDVITLPKYRALYLDEELKERESLSVSRDSIFDELINNFKTIENSDFQLPETLKSILREYQKKGFMWIKSLHQSGFCGILADDMGLGKTLQVITFLLSEYEVSKDNDNCRTLIVCPASLVFNWSNEFAKFAPNLPVRMAVGTAQERLEVLENLGEKDILITSYDLVRRDIELYKDLEFHCQVIDESQYIKNGGTQAAKAVKLINAEIRLALTGTPIENRLSELWSVFDYLMPGYLFNYRKFRREFEVPIVQDKDKQAMKRLQKMIAPFILRRLKKDVLTDLPDKLEETIYVNIKGEQQKLYDAHVKRLQLQLKKQTDDEFKLGKIQILSELTKLRQICCDPSLIYENYKAESGKIDVCMELIRNAISGGHKILLFSQFTSMLKIIEEELRKENIEYYLLTGATSKEKRIELVDKFNNDDVPVFCISLKAGGTGLNLTAADVVIHFDPWWNYAVQNQATDRAHRIGQKNVVNVFKIIVKGTIEENILEVQDKKKELAEQILSGEGVNIGNLTREELMELIG